MNELQTSLTGKFCLVGSGLSLMVPVNTLAADADFALVIQDYRFKPAEVILGVAAGCWAPGHAFRAQVEYGLRALEL